MSCCQTKLGPSKPNVTVIPFSFPHHPTYCRTVATRYRRCQRNQQAVPDTSSWKVPNCSIGLYLLCASEISRALSSWVEHCLETISNLVYPYSFHTFATWDCLLQALVVYLIYQSFNTPLSIISCIKLNLKHYKHRTQLKLMPSLFIYIICLLEVSGKLISHKRRSFQKCSALCDTAPMSQRRTLLNFEVYRILPIALLWNYHSCELIGKEKWFDLWGFNTIPNDSEDTAWNY